MSKPRYDFDHSKMEGVDVDIETSLKEYGIAWIDDGEDILFYYGITYGTGEWIAFDSCYFNRDIDPKKEFDWVDWDDVCDWSGLLYEDYGSLEEIVVDLVRYYGFENVFGTSYWEGFTYEKIFKAEEIK